jgi:hypothetical protein
MRGPHPRRLFPQVNQSRLFTPLESLPVGYRVASRQLGHGAGKDFAVIAQHRHGEAAEDLQVVLLNLPRDRHRRTL